MSKPFKLNSAFKPSGDQPEAIRRLKRLEDGLARNSDVTWRDWLRENLHHCHTAVDLQRPTMVLCAQQNWLAAQLYGEMKEFFPEKRGGIFRLLLRLLSAGGLCTEFRHLY